MQLCIQSTQKVKDVILFLLFQPFFFHRIFAYYFENIHSLKKHWRCDTAEEYQLFRIKICSLVPKTILLDIA